MRSALLSAVNLQEIGSMVKWGCRGKIQMDYLWTLYHRRLASFKLAGLEFLFQWATQDEIAGQIWKMTLLNNLKKIELKGQRNGKTQIYNHT